MLSRKMKIKITLGMFIITTFILTSFSASAISFLTYKGINSNNSFEFQDVKRAISDPSQAYFVNYVYNPIISGKNLYAPAPIKVGATWFNFVGGWKVESDTNDEVYLSTTTDDSLVANWSALTKVVPHGYYIHANDPSVLIKSNVWYMALTTTRPDTTDWVSIITSTNGTSWPALSDTSKEITISGATVNCCARPSILWNATYSRWELYFDGKINGSANNEQYVAYCTDATPKNFVFQAKIGDMVDADIKFVNNQYIVAYRHLGETWPEQIRSAVSSDGINFTNEKIMLSPDPLNAYDDWGVTNGGWAIDGNVIKGFFFGGTDSTSFTTHKIGVALPQSGVMLRSNGSVYHSWRQALSPNNQRVYTGTYTSIDNAEAYDFPGGPALFNQAVTAFKGDVFSINSTGFANSTRTSAWASSQIANMPAGYSIDSNNGTMYSSVAHATQANVEWLAVDMGTSKSVKRLKVTPRGDAFSFPVDFKLQYSPDGLVWYDIPSQNYVGFTSPSTERIFAFDSAINARCLRIYATKLGGDGSGNYYMQIVEMNPQE